MCQQIKTDDILEENAILPNTVKKIGLTSWKAISNIVRTLRAERLFHRYAQLVITFDATQKCSEKS
jgi:hypothetical protein